MPPAKLRLLRSRGGRGGADPPPGSPRGQPTRARGRWSAVAEVSRTWVRRPIPARTLLSSRRLAGMVMDLARGGRRAPQPQPECGSPRPAGAGDRLSYKTERDHATARTPALHHRPGPFLPWEGSSNPEPGLRRADPEARQARKGSRQGVVSASAEWLARTGSLLRDSF